MADASKYPVPVGYRVLIRPKQAPKESVGGIVIPQSARETMEYLEQCGEVISMGPTAFDFCRSDGLPPWCAVGDWIMHNKYVGVKFDIKLPNGDTETVKIINDKEVLAKTVEPDSLKGYAG